MLFNLYQSNHFNYFFGIFKSGKMACSQKLVLSVAIKHFFKWFKNTLEDEPGSSSLSSSEEESIMSLKLIILKKKLIYFTIN